MARLSEMVGDYTNTGMVVDRQQLVSVGGETTFKLSFIEGSEEVYVNGCRKMNGSSKDYITIPDYIVFNHPLEADDEVILIGRSSSNEMLYKRSVGESQILRDGQIEVNFQTIGTEGIDIYVGGTLTDRGKLTSPYDYVLKEGSDDSIILTNSFPEGTVIEGIQGNRSAWLDADNLIVNDGTTSRSLSDRFSKITDSDAQFIQTNSTQMQDVRVGLVLVKWSIDEYGVPYEDFINGEYPVIRIGKTYWDPDMAEHNDNFQIISWSTSGSSLSLIGRTSNDISGIVRDIRYIRRKPKSSRFVMTSEDETQYELIVDNDGNLGTRPYP